MYMYHVYLHYMYVCTYMYVSGGFDPEAGGRVRASTVAEQPLDPRGQEKVHMYSNLEVIQSNVTV